MRVFLGLCALIVWLTWSFEASGHEVLELDCGGDWDCEAQAKVLCDAGHTKWCVVDTEEV